MSIDRLGRTNLAPLNIQLGKYLEPTEIKRTNTGHEFRSEWHEEIIARAKWEREIRPHKFSTAELNFLAGIKNTQEEIAKAYACPMLPGTILISSDGEHWKERP